MRPLVEFLKKHHLKFNHAQVGQVSVEYFRLDDLDRLIEEHSSEIEREQQLAGIVRNRNKELVFYKRPEGLKAKYPRSLEPL